MEEPLRPPWLNLGQLEEYKEASAILFSVLLLLLSLLQQQNKNTTATTLSSQSQRSICPKSASCRQDSRPKYDNGILESKHSRFSAGIPTTYPGDMQWQASFILRITGILVTSET